MHVVYQTLNLELCCELLILDNLICCKLLILNEFLCDEVIVLVEVLFQLKWIIIN